MLLNNSVYRHNPLNATISLLTIIYIFVSCGLSGLPGISRLSIISAGTIAFLLFVRGRQLQFPSWLLMIVVLYLYLIVPGLATPVVAFDEVSQSATTFIGTVCVSLVLISFHPETVTC